MALSSCCSKGLENARGWTLLDVVGARVNMRDIVHRELEMAPDGLQVVQERQLEDAHSSDSVERDSQP